MVGLGEEVEPQLIVPQNSVTNLRTKMGLSERNSNLQASINANTLRDSEPATIKCKHCENMAKNFLYLESLMRTNYDPNHQCSLCYSAIKYLQYVNKSIMHIFGNFESIVQAAKTFSVTPAHPKKKLTTARKDKLKSTSQASNASTKSKQGKKKGKAHKTSVKRQEGGGIASLQASFQSSRSIANRKTKSTKSTKKPKKKKNTKKAQLSTHSVRTAEGAPENGSKVSRSKKSKRKVTKASVIVRVLNQKITKEKHKKSAKT